MADEPSSEGGETGGGSGLAGFKAILTKKVGGFPMWAIGLLGVAVVAFILHKRAGSASKKAAPDTSNVGDVTSQTFPYANPMNYTSDVYVNNPQTPAPSPVNPGPAPSPTPVVSASPKPKNFLGVIHGWQPENVIRDMNKNGYNITYADLVAANPGLVANIDWNPTDRVNFFKAPQTYVIPDSDMPKTDAAKAAAVKFLGGVS